MRRTLGLFLAAVLVMTITLATGAPTRAADTTTEPASPTILPTVERQITGGRTGRPFMASIEDPASFGYVEEEYLISGVATDYGITTAGVPMEINESGFGTPAQPTDEHTAPFATRLYVIRPADPVDFNGTVLVEWFNVTGTLDSPVSWALTREHLVRNGYAYVGVSAQQVGAITGALSLRNVDPARYRGLRHPGDDYSYDIFTQAGRLVKDGRDLDLDPMGSLDVEVAIALGESQSGARMLTYINNVHERVMVYNGFIPSVASVEAIRDDLSPILWMNSESEGDFVHAPDSGLYRMWEVAGGSHITWWSLHYMVQAGFRSLFPAWITAFFPPYNRDEAAEDGSRRYGGSCPRNYFPDRYAYNAAVEAIDQWVRTGAAPASVDRFTRDETDRLIYNEVGNQLGGLRLPPIDVPIAHYRATTCGLFGLTSPLPAGELAARYPSHESYVEQMQAATDDAVEAGHMVPFDAAELMAQVERSPIGS